MSDVFNFYVYDDRSIQFALAEPIMLEDKDVTQFRFRIPKSLNGFDMSDWEWWFIFVNPNGTKYTTLLELTDDEDEPDDYSVATYTVGYGFSGIVGTVKFSIEALNVSGEEIVNEWHTKTYSTAVIDTLQGLRAVIPEPEGQTIESLISNLDARVTALEAGGSGLTQQEKNLILQLFSKAAYAESDASTAYTALSNLWSGYSITWSGTGYTKSNSAIAVSAGSSFTSTVTANTGFTITNVAVTMGGNTVQGAWSNGTVTIPNVTGDIVITVTTSQITVSSISAVYTQSGTVYDTDTLDSLKSDLVVTATFMDSTTGVIAATDYTLSGTLTVGTSTITVSYGGKTTTFSVTVTQEPPYDFYDYIQGDGTAYINTGLLASTYCTNDYAQEIKVAGHTSESSKAVCGARQQWGSANARGVWHTNATYSQTYCGKDTGYTMSGSSLDVPVVIKTTTDKKIYFDEVLVDTATGAVSITHTGPITLFAECTSGQGSGYTAISGTNAYAGAFSDSRIYYFKVKDGNGNLVADLRPAVRISDSAIGMYDLIRDEFFQNARDTGALSVGNE